MDIKTPLEKGFTMIEMLFVMAMILILMGTLILYSKQGEFHLLLFKERSRMLQTLIRAKALSIETFGGSGSSTIPCGYGVHFDVAQNKYLIFGDIAPSSGNCGSSLHIYVEGTSQIIASLTLDPNVKIASASLTDIEYVPPNPTIYINPDQPDPAKIVLQTINGNDSSTINLTKAGQISTQ